MFPGICQVFAEVCHWLAVYQAIMFTFLEKILLNSNVFNAFGVKSVSELL